MRCLLPALTKRSCQRSSEVFGFELPELLLDYAEDATMFVPEIGQFTKSSHPRTLSISKVGCSCAAHELFLKRLDEETLQGNATGGGMRLRLPKHCIGEFDSRLHSIQQT